MITFFVLLVMLISLLIVAAIIVLAGSAGFIVVFGDLVVCGLILWLIIRLFRRRK